MLTDGELAALYGRTPASWAGWRFTGTGRYLVAPDGTKMTPERLRGIAWRYAAEERLQAAKARAKKRVRQEVVTVVRIRNDDWHRERFGSLAG